MKEIKLTKYQCEKCEVIYDNSKEAKSCENKPITQDRKVKKGDIVLITSGEGKGKKGKVENTFIYDKFWGHYAWKRYWHTVGLDVKVLNSYGNRQLTFDHYKTIK